MCWIHGILIKMEKNAVFGELLYIGLVFEKGDNKIQCDNVLKRAYSFNASIDLNKRNYLITVCNSNNEHVKIIELMIKLLENILFELDKGFRKDKEKIHRLVFASHNLPRVYLSKGEYTLCLLGQEGINVETALEYSKMSMSEEMIADYKSYFD